MTLNIGRELSVLNGMSVADLRQRYADVFGEASASRHRQFLIRRILWRLQANQDGGLSERARRRAGELAADSDVRLTAPKAKPADQAAITRVSVIEISHDDRLPMPGAVITRPYKGKAIDVRVLPRGFEYEGTVYRTLSAVAKEVTGTHWNGYHFFKLGKKGQAHGSQDA